MLFFFVVNIIEGAAVEQLDEFLTQLFVHGNELFFIFADRNDLHDGHFQRTFVFLAAIALALVAVLSACCMASCEQKAQNNEETTTAAEETEAVTEEATEAETEADEEDTEAENEETEEEAEANVITLGSSDLTITTEKKFEKGEITSEDTDDDQVAYYVSEDTLVDFDVYQWAKATDETLASAAEAEAADYDSQAEMTEINGLSVAFYTAKEESDGEEFDTVSYIIDNGEEFVEIVFWLDGENAAAEVDAILATLAK